MKPNPITEQIPPTVAQPAFLPLRANEPPTIETVAVEVNNIISQSKNHGGNQTSKYSTSPFCASNVVIPITSMDRETIPAKMSSTRPALCPLHRFVRPSGSGLS